MKGILEKVKLHMRSFGEKTVTISGVRYVTWDDPSSKWIGHEVEFEAKSGPTTLCNHPCVSTDFGKASNIKLVE